MAPGSRWEARWPCLRNIWSNLFAVMMYLPCDLKRHRCRSGPRMKPDYTLAVISNFLISALFKERDLFLTAPLYGECGQCTFAEATDPLGILPMNMGIYVNSNVLGNNRPPR